MQDLIETTPTLPVRPSDGHKGTFGRVGVVGGSAGDDPRMVGAPGLAALGALRSGCGLVRIAAPAPILDAVLSVASFATGVSLPTDGRGGLDGAGAAERFDGLASGSDALAVGPGLGGSAATVAMTPVQIPSEPGRFTYAINGSAYRGAYATGGSMMYRLPTKNPMAVGFGFSRAGGKNSAVRFGVAGEF